VPAPGYAGRRPSDRRCGCFGHRSTPAHGDLAPTGPKNELRGLSRRNLSARRYDALAGAAARPSRAATPPRRRAANELSITLTPLLFGAGLGAFLCERGIG
jgi:hypothetical protein